MVIVATSIAVLAAILALIMLADRNAEKRIESTVYKELAKIRETYPGLLESEEQCSYYTTGHPYVWVDSNRRGFEKALYESSYVQSRGPKFALDRPVYSLKIDRIRNSIYFVPNVSEFDFDSLLHYQEWLESEPEVAKNIAKYRQRNS